MQEASIHSPHDAMRIKRCVGSGQSNTCGVPALPAMGWHYRGSGSAAKQKAPTRAGAFHATGAGNRSRTCDLRYHEHHLMTIDETTFDCR